MIRIFLLLFFYAANTFSYVDKGETFEYLKTLSNFCKLFVLMFVIVVIIFVFNVS